MKNNMKKILIFLFTTTFLLCLLFCSKKCMTLASQGLLIWYQNMIPTLFPFMVLSGFLVRTRLSDKISILLQPFFGWIFRLPSSMLYGIFMGFLCGFPMGAKVVADMLEQKQISRKQGEYLLSFCNNIGPLYLLGYVIPLFHWENTTLIFSIMYGVPLFYGIFLRYFSSYKKFLINGIEYKSQKHKTQNNCTLKTAEHSINCSNILHFQLSLQNAIEQITLLGGCMIFFNCLQIYPYLLGETSGYFFETFFQTPFCCLLEIGGGLKGFTKDLQNTYFSLCFLTFGGLSCIMQTCFILKNTGLSIGTYIRHKFIQSLLTGILVFLIN